MALTFDPQTGFSADDVSDVRAAVAQAWKQAFRSDNTGEETFTLEDNKEPKKFTYSLEDRTLKLTYADKSEKVYSVEYDSDSLTLSESARKVTFERQK